MLKSYLLAAYQNLVRHKLFALINIVGLAIGFSVFSLISLYVNNEYSYDKHWQNADRIYLLSDDFKVNEQMSFKNAMVPYPAMPVLQQYFPDAFEYTARRLYRGDHVIVDETRFEDAISLFEKDIIKILQLDVLAGSLENTLASPGNVALSEEIADKYFGDNNPLGKTISLNVPEQGLVDYQVSAVYKLPEGVTSVFLPSFALLDENALPEMKEGFTDWSGIINTQNFFLLKPGVNIDLMNQQLDAFINQYLEEPWRILDENTQLSDFHTYEFQALSEIHFDTELQGQQAADINKIISFAVIGVLVLLIGSTNFIILTTAKAEERRREVGIRKVLGASKKQLILQFLGESILLCLLALILALAMTALFSPYFSTLIAKGLPLNVFTPTRIGLLLMVTLLVGILGGLYPAFVLANFDAVKIFKPFTKRPFFGSITLRSVLVTFQFSIAIMLIVATMVLYTQLSFYKNRDPGFNPDNLLTLSLSSQTQRESITPLMNEFRQLPGVEIAGLSTMPPNRNGFGMMTGGSFTPQKSDQNKTDFSGIWVGYDFFDVYQMPIIAGRSFDLALDPIPLPRDPDEEASDEPRPPTKLIINRSLSAALGFNSPIDAIGELIYQQVTAPDETNYMPYELIGVVEDSHFQSLRENSGSESFTLRLDNSTTVGIRFQGSIENTIREDIASIWLNIIGDDPLRASFVAQNVELEFLQEANDGKIVMTFSILAIFVSCIGLYGLASFTIKSKIKEIGIRKVLGADFKAIIALFIWQFSKPVLVANVIAAPLALWAVLSWLQRFPEQIDYLLLLPIFLLAGIMTLIVACITVGSSTARAASADPVKSLRYE